jgi:hypothetical protein
MQHSVMSARLPRSGNAALGNAALIQAVVGAEFVLAGVNKFVDAEYVTQFRGFVQASPGARGGPLSGLIEHLVLPHLDTVAQLSRSIELGAGLILVLTAAEVGRRRLAGRVGAQHAYEPLLALVSAAAAVAVGGMSLSIYLLEGGRWPGINPGFAFTSPIAIELLLVPLALGIAWLELARFSALRATEHQPRRL